MPPSRLKRLLAQGETTLGLWVTLEAPSITEIASTMGLDWVVIDAEHGHLDLKEIVEHLRAARNTKTTPLVRIQEIEQGLIKRVLDIGAEGILVPQVRTAEEVARAVAFAKYPPQGVRGIGAERSTRWGMGIPHHVRTANARTLVIPIVENVRAVENFREILSVPGIDAIFFGPHDLAASAGHPGEWANPKVMRSILEMRRRAARRGIPCGILAASAAEARLRRKQGFHMIGIGIDSVLLIRAAQEMLAALGRPVRKEAWHA